MVYQHDKGSPCPLGSLCQEGGINFALFSEHATAVTLCLFTPGGQLPFQEISLDPKYNKTGWVWHVLVKGLPAKTEYGYRLNGSDHFNPSLILSDPYSRSLSTKNLSRIVPSQESFDWGNDAFPDIPMQNLIIYEMHARGFTQDASSKVMHPGTFSGVIDKIPHLKALGINAVELMPIHFFDTATYKAGHQGLENYWGYMTINYFSPMHHFSSSKEWEGALQEFKTMVKELHKNQIEVILDVVFNHTAEGGKENLYFSFKGIDNAVYYILDEEGKYLDFTGCGNTLNCNHPVVSRLIIDALRYWVVEMHVDGFRFDLASVFSRDQKGNPLTNAPLIEAIAKDSILGNVKLIAEAWDASGLYQVGSFAPNERWAEWNGKYRDTVRRFIKGTDGEAGAFATAICGSQDLYWEDKQPYHSINFITAHDGFTAQDLVSYQQKHNEANGENNQDGTDEHNSWNCGVEGETQNLEILQLRERQRKNLHMSLMLSIGTPMLLMGDEYGHTRKGNNNAWCQDNTLNWFLWDKLDQEKSFFRFYAALIHFRRNHPVLRRSSFLSSEDIDWHGKEPFKPNWSPENRFLAYTLKDRLNHHDLYVAYNPNPHSESFQLPPPPEKKEWYRVIDTSLKSPDDFREDPSTFPPLKLSCELPAYSAFLAKAF